MLVVHIIAWQVPVVLVIVLVASALIFRMLVRRWTTRKHWLELSRWAGENGMKLQGADKAMVPAPLATAINPAPTASMSISSDHMAIVELHTLKAQRTDSSQFTTWRALVRQIEPRWLPTGLRPRANASSMLDLFSLSSFPSMAPPERFVVFGTDSAAARRVAGSSLLALLPPDLGLLLHGSTLLLDFSARPFDTIELSRLCALADQLLAHLPSAK
jgi:hypothetical protein